MSIDGFRDRTAVSGVGWTPLTKRSGETALTLGTTASLAAIADAGLEPADIDGLVTFYWGTRDTPAPGEMVAALGLTSCHMSFCDSSGGAWACSALAAAAMAVHSGVCRNVLVYRAANSRSEPLNPATADLWPSGQRQWSEPFGATHAATLYGPSVSAYMAHYGIGNADFAELAVQQRANASLNAKALMKKPITAQDHQASPWIIEPFRLLDCSAFNDGAMAVVVSSARDVRRRGDSTVTIRAVEGGSLGTPVTARTSRNRWELNAAHAAPALYYRAGMTVEDIDIAQVYDPFTGMALLHIEQFGLTEPGGAARSIGDGELSLDGRLPVNTHGGHLSEGNVAGLGHVIEAVQQLRAGGVRDDNCDGDHDYDRTRCRQVRDPEVALVVGESGDSSLLLTRVS
ncbi:thiolase family protein [Rhodococcus sp. T2V]|uniref:thiolase family protein n=1 Tax=Rhodococcus sp. T2V TaxID=3034164 RepID=UPI0023E31557|nr:thiolase family protein [Rhodococcus sp. T2V]MDF3305335.1 thiolase family protein [Rhodococcus sp. T2V]